MHPMKMVMNGGYANDQGNAFVQYFPADEFTAQVIEGGGENVWTVSIDYHLPCFHTDLIVMLKSILKLFLIL